MRIRTILLFAICILVVYRECNTSFVERLKRIGKGLINPLGAISAARHRNRNRPVEQVEHIQREYAHDEESKSDENNDNSYTPISSEEPDNFVPFSIDDDFFNSVDWTSFSLKQVAKLFVWYLAEILMVSNDDPVLKEEYQLICDTRTSMYIDFGKGHAAGNAIYAIGINDSAGNARTVYVVESVLIRNEIRKLVSNACARIIDVFKPQPWKFYRPKSFFSMNWMITVPTSENIKEYHLDDRYRRQMLISLVSGNMSISRLLYETSGDNQSKAVIAVVDKLISRGRLCTMSYKQVIKSAIYFALLLEADIRHQSVDDVYIENYKFIVDLFRNKFENEIQLSFVPYESSSKSLKRLKFIVYVIIQKLSRQIRPHINELGSDLIESEKLRRRTLHASILRVLYDYEYLIMFMIDTEPMKQLLEAYCDLVQFDLKQYAKNMLTFIKELNDVFVEDGTSAGVEMQELKNHLGQIEEYDNNDRIPRHWLVHTGIVKIMSAVNKYAPEYFRVLWNVNKIRPRIDKLRGLVIMYPLEAAVFNKGETTFAHFVNSVN